MTISFIAADMASCSARAREPAGAARPRSFAARLARGFAPADFAAVFADPDQLALFAPALDAIQPVLTTLAPDPADP